MICCSLPLFGDSSGRRLSSLVRQRRSSLRRLAVLCLALLALAGLDGTSRSEAQQAPENLHELHHTSYTAADGLYGEVKALAQTPDGFLWVGTSEGLYRFDGVIFEPYVPEHGVLPDTAVTALLVQADGTLWVGFAHGAIAHLRLGKIDVYTEASGYPYGPTRALVQAPDGAVWAAVVGSLVRFDGSAWRKVRMDWNYPGRSASGLFVDRQGTLWVGTSDRLVYLPAGSHHFRDHGMPGKWIISFAQSPNGTLWLSDGNTDTIQAFCSPLGMEKCGKPGVTLHIGAWKILTPKVGGMWFATEVAGVRRAPDAEKIEAATTSKVEGVAESFSDHDGLSGRYCWTLLEDREGDVWAGTKGGLDRFRFSRIRWTDVGVGRLALLSGDHGKPWIATDMIQDPKQVDDQIPPSLKPLLATLYAAARDRDGVLWLGNHRRIYTWKSSVVSEVLRPTTLMDGSIYSIGGDNSGGAWVSIAGHGEFHFVHGTWDFIPVPGAEPDIAARSTYVDDANRAWLAYDARKQVSVIENGHARSFSEKDGLLIGSPEIIAGTGAALLVGGTQGLAYRDGERFLTLHGPNGEDFPSVFGIVPTPGGDVWLNTARGVAHLASSDIRTCIRISCTRLPSTLVDLRGDLRGPLGGNASGVGVPLSLLDGSGNLWFATNGGAAMLDPKDFVQTQMPPTAVIRGVVIEGKNYDSAAKLSLPGRIHALQIHYTAPSISRPEEVRYRYRLLNWDNEWQDAGARQLAIYSNLGPGRYAFQVVSCDTKGQCNPAVETMTLIVTPSFYQTAWFRLLMASVVGFALWLLYRVRMQQIVLRSGELLQERLSERERIARDLHDTLLQGVQALMFKFHVATNKLRSDEPMLPIFQETLAQSDQVLLQGRNLISELHSESGPPGHLLESLQQIADELETRYPVNFVAASRGMERELSAIAEEEIRSLGREALTNAFQHAGAKNISLTLRYSLEDLQLEITDDGGGIPNEILANGFRSGHWGLRSMKARARSIDAHLKLSSSPESGTTVHVVVPFSSAYANGGRRLRAWKQSLNRWTEL
jgi:signal transduction histidine kinase/ligand-binding sensor domain-containing protein